MVENSKVEKESATTSSEDRAGIVIDNGDDYIIGAFPDNVAFLLNLLKLINDELESPNSNDLRIQVYFNDVLSIQQELAAQQVIVMSAKGRSDPDVVRLQSILANDMPALQAKLESRVERDEQRLKEINAKYADEKSKLEAELRALTARLPPAPPIDKSPIKDDDDGMNARISKLESDVAAIKIDVAVIRSNYASKEDIAGVKTQLTEARLVFATKEEIHREMNLQTWKLIGVAAALVAAVYFLAKPSPSAAPYSTATQAQSVQPIAPQSATTK